MPVICTRIIALFCAASPLFGMTACATTRIVGDRFVTPPTLQGGLDRIVAPNDQVVVTTTDGTRVALTVTAVSADALEGRVDDAAEATRLPIERIARIERREKDSVKTTVLVVGIVIVVLAVVYAMVSSIPVTAMAP
jgi:hypothetical protein